MLFVYSTYSPRGKYLFQSFPNHLEINNNEYAIINLNLADAMHEVP
jgi:hypothetical protein